jgi:hypothetical protein
MTAESNSRARNIRQPGPPRDPDQPFAYFQWNHGWGAWEQVSPEYSGQRGVVAAYRKRRQQS